MRYSGILVRAFERQRSVDIFLAHSELVVILSTSGYSSSRERERTERVIRAYEIGLEMFLTDEAKDECYLSAFGLKTDHAAECRRSGRFQKNKTWVILYV